MRRFLIGISLLALAACSKSPEGTTVSGRGAESMVESDAAKPAPGVGVTAAPGVAFDYRYSFELPALRIAAAQEGHAQACERLGIARCRITGMRYRLSGEDRIDAMLSFKLDPTLARGFGRQGIAAIEAAQGMLVDASITGTDAGAELEKQADLRRQAETERTRLDRELARPGLGATERAELQRQRSALLAAVGAARSSFNDARATLASTPVTFDYESGRAVSNFGNRSVLTRALDTATLSAETTFAFVIGALALLGPPALLLAALWVAWRWLRRRYFPVATPEA